MPRYIDADKLNIAIEEWFDGACVYDVSPSEAVFDFQSIVDDQPTISPDEVRGVGEWIEDRMRIKCSVCGTDFNDEVTCCSDCYRWPWQFCPSCGARMKGGAE